MLLFLKKLRNFKHYNRKVAREKDVTEKIAELLKEYNEKEKKINHECS